MNCALCFVFIVQLVATCVAKSKQRRTYIKQERTTALDLVRNDVDDGGGTGLFFDETMDCCDDHPPNIILTTQKHVALHFVPLGTLPSC